MENKDLSRFDGVIVTKNFTACKMAITSGSDIILAHPFMTYTVMMDGHIYVKVLANGINQRQRWPEYRYPMTDELKEQLIRIESIVSSDKNEAMVKDIAKICGVSDTYLRQQISMKISYGVNINGVTPMKALGMSNTGPSKVPIESRKFDEIIGKTKLDIGRACDNHNKNTFDYITVDVVIKLPYQEAKLWVKTNRKQVLQYAINTVANRTAFKKFNVPVNFLRINGIILCHDCTLHITFGLKGDDEIS